MVDLHLVPGIPLGYNVEHSPGEPQANILEVARLNPAKLGELTQKVHRRSQTEIKPSQAHSQLYLVRILRRPRNLESP
jgi:hypothetical protein